MFIGSEQINGKEIIKKTAFALGQGTISGLFYGKKHYQYGIVYGITSNLTTLGLKKINQCAENDERAGRIHSNASLLIKITASVTAAAIPLQLDTSFS